MPCHPLAPAFDTGWLSFRLCCLTSSGPGWFHAPRVHWWSPHVLLSLSCLSAVGNVLTESEMAQTQTPTGEYMFAFDQDEIFHVDLQKKEAIWRLPEFGEFASFEAAGALGIMAVMKTNLGISMKRSNNTAAKNGKSPFRLITGHEKERLVWESYVEELCLVTRGVCCLKQ
ncbi:mamu class II histocompatibility antigen, DR alpha chain-like [Rhinatrema bivittatum]|uniref:mamu class II histocompatibility antigen, DR alpha chain-like n=1 Tax=Rhinatrema bivittatum TaxID=194408 RepID=UPI001128E058|nr:mamu class II histocompatibility antigen, DR alpha chain-like [Rhinatrema bivittatum]